MVGIDKMFSNNIKITHNNTAESLCSCAQAQFVTDCALQSPLSEQLHTGPLDNWHGSCKSKEPLQSKMHLDDTNHPCMVQMGNCE